VQLIADVKWNDRSPIVRLRKQLVGFICSEKTSLKRIFEDSAPLVSDHVELSIKCGKVNKRSYFVFFRNSRNKSRIMGACSTNRLVDLIDDFDFLKEQMTKSNIAFNVSDPKVTLDGNKLIEGMDNKILKMKTVLADFFGIISFASGATAYLFFGELNQITISMFILGLVFWIGSVVAGERSRPKYVLIEPE